MKINDIVGVVPTLQVLGLPSVVRVHGTLLIRQDTPGAIRAQVFSVSGRWVRTLYDGAAVTRRTAVSCATSAMSPGVYFARVTTPAGTLVRRLVVAE